MLPAGFYWYGAKRRSSGRTPTWLQRMLNAATHDDAVRPTTENTSDPQGEDAHSENCGRPTSPDVPRSKSPEPRSEDSHTEDVHDEVSTSQGPTDPSDEETREDDVEAMVSAHEQGSEDVAQRHHLEDFSVLTYAVLDRMPTTPPVTSRYSLRDRSRRQQPRRLMQVNSSGRT